MTLRSDAGAELKSYIERIERLGVERRELGDEQKALFAEAKSKGFDPKAMRKIIKRRDKDPARSRKRKRSSKPTCTRSACCRKRRCIGRWPCWQRTAWRATR